MVAITQGQIDAIQGQWQTVEEIAAWSTLLLEQFAGSQVVLEKAGNPIPAAEVSDFRDSVGNSRYTARISLVLANDYRTNGLKVWNSVQPLVDAVIPAAYLS